MKKAVINNSQFELCTLDNPTGYPVSFTHAGIAYSEDGYNGYHYFLSQSPFPSGNDSYENPCFYYANAREGNLPPKDWIAYSGNPLQEDPTTSVEGYNADPDILFVGGDLYVTNRPYISSPNRTWVNAQKCLISNGEFSFGEPVDLFDTNTLPRYFGYENVYRPGGGKYPSLLSPAFIIKDNKIRSYHLVSNTSNDGGKTKNIVIMEGTDLVTENNFSFLKYGSMFGHDIEPWHLDVFEHGGKLYAIVACTVDYTPNNTYNFLAVSEDWENFRIYDRPLSNIKSYRSSAFVREDGMFIIYLATLGYKPAGNVTLDGRNIVVASIPFDKLLDEIKK